MFKKIIVFFLLLSGISVNAQQLPSLSEIKKKYKKTINSDEGQSYRFLNKSKDGNFLLFCYQNGNPIKRYSNLKLKSFESKFLYYDVITKDGREIRVPYNSCFIEVKK